MRLWHAFRVFLHTWQGVALSIVAALGAIYYGPRQMLETWYWYLDKFRDEPILDTMYQLKLPDNLMPDPRGPQYTPPTIVSILKEGSYSVGDLANILKRSHTSIGKSLRRLRRKGKVEEYRGGFRLKQ